MTELRVELYSHHFACTKIGPRARAVINQFAKNYLEYKLAKIPRSNRWTKVPDRVYGAATKDREEYRFHINTLKEFKEILDLNLLRGHLIEWVEVPLKTPPRVLMSIDPNAKPFDYQEEAIEFILQPTPVSKLLGFQTGFGKSFTSLYSQYKREQIGVIVIKPMYIEKWLIDLRKAFNLATDDVIVVQGAVELMGMLELASVEDKPSYQWIIVSNKTYQNWLKLYEEHRENLLEMGYACSPYQFYEHVKAGTRIIDEGHQDFHLNYKIDCYTHVSNSLTLTATLITDDPFKRKMHEIAYPHAARHAGPEYKKYIAFRAVFYSFKDPTTIKTTDWGSNRYSHNVLEQWIIKDKDRCENYCKLINAIIRGTYIKDKLDGDKLVVFCASVNFCTHLTNWLKKEYPNLDVGRYVEEDDYEMALRPDIRVTTLMSAGTAIDIPGLTHTLLTTAIKSPVANVQGLGRLRQLPDGRAPVFITMNCSDIQKHIDWHGTRKELLGPKTISYRQDNIGILV